MPWTPPGVPRMCPRLQGRTPDQGETPSTSGSLLNPDGLADKLVPAAGQALVGLSLGAAQRPGLALDAGDAVEIVYTPGANDQARQGLAPSPGRAGVVSPSDDPDAGRLIVNVTV